MMKRDLRQGWHQQLGVPSRRAAAWPDQFGAAPSSEQLEILLSDAKALFKADVGDKIAKIPVLSP